MGHLGIDASTKDVDLHLTANPPRCASTDEHWAALAYAMLRIMMEDSSKLTQYSPELKPWMPKGRILVKMRQSIAGTRGGAVALERYLAEQKVEKTKANGTSTPCASPSKKRVKPDA